MFGLSAKTVFIAGLLIVAIIGSSRLAPWRQARVDGWRGMAVEAALEYLGHRPENAIFLERLTAYNGVPQQTDSDPKTASCGRNRADGLALSQDLFFDAAGSKHLCGTKVRVLVIDPETETVEALQTRTVWDTMSPDYSNTGDLFFKSQRAARDWGVKRAAIVVLEP